MGCSFATRSVVPLYLVRSGGYIGPFLRIDRGFLIVGRKLP